MNMDEKISKGIYNYQNIREFKADALAELKMAGHPKADLLFSKAWEYGHHAGLSEVWYYMQDLKELIEG